MGSKKIKKGREASKGEHIYFFHLKGIVFNY